MYRMFKHSYYVLAIGPIPSALVFVRVNISTKDERSYIFGPILPYNSRLSELARFNLMIDSVKVHIH